MILCGSTRRPRACYRWKSVARRAHEASSRSSNPRGDPGALCRCASGTRAELLLLRIEPVDGCKVLRNNAVQSGTLSIPSGMSMQQFQAYGVAVLRILQSGHTYFMVLGAGAAISDAMPPTNVDGSANQAAQDAAVNAIVDSALTNGLITLPNNVSESQVQQFARETTGKMDSNDGPSFSPGGVLRMIDSYMITYTDSSGNVNWTSVSSALNTAVTNMIGSGMIKDPPE